MKDSLSTVIDSFFLFAATFLFFLTGLRFFCSFPLALVIAAFLGGGATVPFYLFRHKRYGKACTNKREAAFAKGCMETLGKIPYEEAESFMQRLYELQLKEKLSPRRANGKVLYYSEGGRIFAFFPEYFPVKAERLMDLLRNNPTARPLTVAACGFEEGAKTLGKAFNATLLGPEEIFMEMKQQDFYPKLPESGPEKRFRLGKYLRELLSRKRSKRFFALGAWMTVFSLFIPFPTYYLISGGVFLCLSAFCLLFGVKA